MDGTSTAIEIVKSSKFKIHIVGCILGFLGLGPSYGFGLGGHLELPGKLKL